MRKSGATAAREPEPRQILKLAQLRGMNVHRIAAMPVMRHIVIGAVQDHLSLCSCNARSSTLLAV